MRGRKGAKMSEDRHILVVDDDERVLFILNRTLRTLANGYQIETAWSGQEALEKARRTPIALLITDLAMPGMDGVELTEAIRNLDADVAVIWITAHGCRHFSSEAARLSVHDCLEKPIRVKDIRQAVLKALKDARSGASMQVQEGSNGIVR
jgi:DNA-binding NtrC family response regulator